MANAGSGKTTALTARVVRLLLLGVPPERIVCITYTKAAASEMRARVLEKLRGLLLAEEAECRAHVSALLGAPASDAQVAQARGLFAAVLDSPSGGVQLTTIHGFCQSILRRFPLEAGITPHFTVLEDAAAEDLLARAKQAVLRSHSTDDTLAAALELIAARGGEHRFEALAGDIIRARRLWKQVWHLQSAESLRGHIYALHDLTPDLTEATLADALWDSLSASDAAVIRAHLPELLAHSTKSYRELGEKLAAWLGLEEARQRQEISAFLGIFLTQAGEPRSRLLNAKEHPEGTPLCEVLARWAEYALRYADRAAALACAEETFATAIFAQSLLVLYEAAKAASHALDYDDLIDHTLRLCSSPETLGWVMTKLDHRIDHLLIDEAQDNSEPIWQLAHTLVEELMGSAEATPPRSLLVVGDEKQSIYSFQGAAPEQFDAYRGRFKQSLAERMEEGVLEHSYRSTRCVLSLVDAVCAQPEIAASLSAQAVVVRHGLKREKPEDVGQVVLYPPLNQPENEKFPPLVMPTSYAQTTHAAQHRAEQIANVIDEWLRAQRPLISKGRPVQAGDILILVNKRAPLVLPLIRALQRRAIPVAGLDRLTLAEHLAVKDLLALMRWCGNVADDLALAQVLRSPLVGLTDEELRALAHGREGSLWAQVSNPWLVQVLGWRHLAPYDFLTQVLEVSTRRREFARRFGAEVHEVLDELKTQAAAMPLGMPNSLAEFEAWLSGSTRQIKREQDTGAANEVRIMTVHGAKGLEAPVVMLADTVNVPNTGKERIFSMASAAGQVLPVLSFSSSLREAARLTEAKAARKTKLLAEYQRLLYVALTRARDELHIFGTASKKGEVKQGAWYASIADAMRTLGATEEADGCLLWREENYAEGVVLSQLSRVETVLSSVLALPAWAHTAPSATEISSASLAPSRVEGGSAKPYAASRSEGVRERGVRIHRVLELLTAGSDAHHITQLVRHIAPDWAAAEQQRVADMVMQLHAQERWIWTQPHWPEVNVAGEIVRGGQAIPINGQVDMLVQLAEGYAILDYKTGAQVPKTPTDVPISYLLQLKLYHAVLRQLYPDTPIRCAILWTHTAQLMWLDTQVEAAAFSMVKNSLVA